MASPTRWTWVWVNSGSWWWTGRPGVLQSMGLQSQTQLSNWTELNWSLQQLCNSCCLVTHSCPTLCDPMDQDCQASLSFTIYWSLLKLISIKSVMPSSHLNLCCSLLFLPSTFPSIRVFSSESALCIRWPKYWSFSISPSKEYSGLISLRMDWFHLLAVQGTLKSFPQHHSSKSSVLWCSTFFIVQLSHPYMTTGKTIALTRWTFVGKVMSLF